MAGIAGTKEPSTAVNTHQNVDNALPASQHMPPGAGTPPTQVALLSRQQDDTSVQDLFSGLISGRIV